MSTLRKLSVLCVSAVKKGHDLKNTAETQSTQR